MEELNFSLYFVSFWVGATLINYNLEKEILWFGCDKRHSFFILFVPFMVILLDYI